MSASNVVPFQLRSQRAASRAAQARGDDAEDLVARIHAAEPFRRGAALNRRYARVQGGRYTEPQGPDFSGHLLEEGARHVEVEVKAVKGGSLAFDCFTWREVRDLTLCRRAGGLAVVLVLHGPSLPAATWCAVPWWALEDDALAWVHSMLPAWRKAWDKARTSGKTKPRDPSPWAREVSPLCGPEHRAPALAPVSSLHEDALRRWAVPAREHGTYLWRPGLLETALPPLWPAPPAGDAEIPF